MESNTFNLENLYRYRIAFVIDGKESEIQLPDFLLDKYEDYMEEFCLILFK